MAADRVVLHPGGYYMAEKKPIDNLERSDSLFLTQRCFIVDS